MCKKIGIKIQRKTNDTVYIYNPSAESESIQIQIISNNLTCSTHINIYKSTKHLPIQITMCLKPTSAF